MVKSEQVDADNGVIRIVVEADQEIARLLKTQFEKQIDVIKVL